MTLEKVRFSNYYVCPKCKTEWNSEWNCVCDDRCPECDTSCSPSESIDQYPPEEEE